MTDDTISSYNIYILSFEAKNSRTRFTEIYCWIIKSLLHLLVICEYRSRCLGLGDEGNDEEQKV